MLDDANVLEGKSVLLDIAGISKKYGQFSALDHVNLKIYQGETHCLLGENGAGKSTLCKIIYGETTASEGSIHFRNQQYKPRSPADALNLGIAMVHQHYSLIPSMRVYENLMLGNIRGFQKIKSFVDNINILSEQYRLDIDPYARIDEISVGQQQRVEILKCLIKRPQLLILDEPTAVLLPHEIEGLLDVCEQIVSENRSIILVTHKLAEISRLASNVTVLRNGKSVKSCEFKIEKIDSLVRAMFDKDIEDDHLNSGDLSDKTQLSRAVDTKQESLIIDGITYSDERGKICLSNLTMVIESGKIHGLVGVEDNGQSELGDILGGIYSPKSGRIYIGNKDLTNASPSVVTASGIGIVPEDRLKVGCIKELTLTENLIVPFISRYKRFGLIKRNEMKLAAIALMEKFDIRAESPDIPFMSLSGGNQQKAVLGRELSLNPLKFLVAAQPTRGLDIGAVKQVYNQIYQAADRGVGILLISSELDDMIAICDKISIIYRGEIVGTLPAEKKYRDKITALMSGGIPASFKEDKYESENA